MYNLKHTNMKFWTSKHDGFWKTDYEEWYWSNRSDAELRRTMYDTELLDAERADARRELMRRTHNQKINDTLSRRIEIA